MPSLQPGLELQMLPLNYVASLNEKIAWPNSLLLLTYRGGGHDSYREMKARTYRRKVSGCFYEMGRYVPSSPATATTCTYSKKCLIEYS